MDGDFFEAHERGETEPALVVDVVGFEGPLDLLLDLARRQKVDLHEISVLALAEQYLAFVEAARGMRLELAADYLVMAAWLAYLKSRLLLPEPPRAEGPTAGELASALAYKLRRLEAVRAAGARLAERDQLGRDIFGRGEPARSSEPGSGYTATLHELLAAYGRGRRKPAAPRLELARRPIWSLVEAREALDRLLGTATDWTDLNAWLARYVAGPAMRPTVLASALSVALEMAREGRLALRQVEPFGPLLLHRDAAEVLP